jgi:hypothetical protein
MAIAVPVLFLIVFGIIEFGFLFYRNISLSQGVRETARQATVANYSGNIPTCTGPAPNQLACLADERVGLGPKTAAWLHINVVGATNVGDQVTLCTAYPVESITGLMKAFLPNGPLHSKVTMRLERPLLAGTVDGGDAPLPSDSWAWCT